MCTLHVSFSKRKSRKTYTLNYKERDEQMSALSPNSFSQESCILHGFRLYFSSCSINPPDHLLSMTVEAAAEVEVVLDVGCVLDLMIPKSYAPEVELFSEA